MEFGFCGVDSGSRWLFVYLVYWDDVGDGVGEGKGCVYFTLL